MPDSRKVIGLAGPMAAGKDVVAKHLHEKGYTIIDVDKLGHIALEDSKNEILSLFSPVAKKMKLDLVDTEGYLNRRNLGKIVFASKKNLRMHESIVHPKMNALIEKELENKPYNDFVINAAILHKFKAITLCNATLYVTANPFLRYKRAKTRNNISKMQFFKTFLSQIEIYPKCKKLNADIYRVDNSDTHELLLDKIDSILGSCF